MSSSHSVSSSFTRLKEDKRPRAQRTPASRALWRAFSALSAARYYLEDESEQEEQVRELRRRVEDLWREVSPMLDGQGALFAVSTGVLYRP